MSGRAGSDQEGIRQCASGSLSCGNGSSRTQHPIELLGEDWLEYGDWGFETSEDDVSASTSGQH
ncbi:DUF3079 domain-containing protein [Paraburkholderia oxyphila]|uniref:DUF3079 domain-containing protein n=1 Tax=Paraburkholderia oxyphila TaxID=614212 RepID=UPI0009FF5764|nr:DUF3079 domain-containing protein [Paraburkholderia oxyphila]